jgi:HSP20 family protein
MYKYMSRDVSCSRIFNVEDILMVARYSTLINEPVRLREAVDRLFGEPFLRTIVTGPQATRSFAIPVDMFATGEDVTVIASVPGLGPDDLEVTIDGDVLTLSGQIPNVAASTEAKDATWYLKENTNGQFRRSLTLPVEVDADKVEATVQNGILRLKLAKAAAARPRKIQIQEKGAAPAE